MSTKFQIFFILLALGIVSVSSQNNSIITAKTADLPTDGVGIVGGANRNNTSRNATSNNSTLVDSNTAPNRTDESTSILPLGDDISRISGVAGFVYSWTLQPIFNLIWFLLSPIFSLVREVLSPVLLIVDYLLGTVGLPGLFDLLDSLLKTLIAWLATILTNLSSALNTIFGSQPGTQPTRRRRATSDSSLSPILAPFTLLYNTIMLPFTIVETIYNIVSTPFWFISYPLSWLFWGLGSPVSMGYSMLTWPLWEVLHMIGLGGSEQPEVEIAADDLIRNSTSGRSDRDSLVNEVIGALSEGTQQALLQAATQGYSILKNDILPALDSTAVTYQNSDLIPDNLKTYLRGFHQAYSMLHMVRIV